MKSVLGKQFPDAGNWLSGFHSKVQSLPDWASSNARNCSAALPPERPGSVSSSSEKWQEGRNKLHSTWSPEEQGYLLSLTSLVLGPFSKKTRLQANTFIKMDVFNKSKPWSKISSSLCHSFVCQVLHGKVLIPDYNIVWLHKAHNEKKFSFSTWSFQKAVKILL